MGANSLPKTISGQHRHLGYAIPWDRRNRLIDGVQIPLNWAFSVSAPSTWNSVPAHIHSIDTLKKGKVFPYSLPSVGPGADPGVQAVSPQVT